MSTTDSAHPTPPAAAAMNPQLLRDWARASADALTTLRGEINDLNVFPIPDSDTGSNMVFTMSAAADAAAETDSDASVTEVARAIADGAVANARGNSGIILSQVLVGVADAADLATTEADQTFNRLWSTGLRLASLGAVRAVSDPREGTVLTVLRVAAQTAADYVTQTAADQARAVADDAAESLEHTPEQLPELAYAGVVDAGGRGLLALLDAMVLVLSGVANKRRVYRGILVGGGDLTGHAVDEPCAGAGDMDFEVMYFLDSSAGERIGRLRDYLDEIGDSIVIVGDSSGGGERFSVHVHTSDPGKAVEAGTVVGQISDVRISCFALDALRAAPNNNEPPPRHKRAVVVAVKGDGAEALFTEAGALVVRADDGLSAGVLAEAIRATDSAHVVVMANGALPAPELVSVAAEAHSSQRSVVFIPTLSMVQCLSALAVHDASEVPDADAYNMAEAAAGTRWGSIVVSKRRMMTLAGLCEVGDLLGFIGSDALVIGQDPVGAGTALIDLLLATGGELMTVLVGGDWPDTQSRETVLAGLTEHVHDRHAGIELAVYDAGQTDQLLQVGVE